MLRLDTLHGFWLLGLVPLLWFLRRHRSRLRRVEANWLPVLRDRLQRAPPRAPRAFRLSRRQRAALSAAVVALLALAVNGPRWVSSGPPPGEWLLVLDNAAPSAARIGGRSVLEHLRRGAARLAESLPGGDAVTLVVTSPEPRLYRFPEDGDLEGALAGVRPEAGSWGVPRLLAFLEEASRGRALRARIVLSPRSALWAEDAGARASAPYVIPPTAEERAGNAGIVAFDLRPSAAEEGAFDVFVAVASGGLPAASVPVVLARPGAEALRAEVALDARGEGRHLWAALPVAPGEVTVRLEGEDALAWDDRVVATVEAPAPLSVALRGKPVPFLAEAVAAHAGFRLLPEGAGGADVEVWGYEGPEAAAAPVVVIAPRGGFLGLRYRGAGAPGGPVAAHPGHPVTRAADLSALRPGATPDFRWPPESRVLARAGEAPLVVAARAGGRRAVVWTFDPVASGLVLEPSFPVLLRDSVEWAGNRRPAWWTRAGGCPDAPLAVAWEDPPPGPAPNLLCPSATEQARAVSLPNLDAGEIRAAEPGVERAADLTAPLAGLALLLAAYGALVNAYASRVS